MSFRHPTFIAAAAIIAIGAAGTPAQALINWNAFTANALNPNALNSNALNPNAITHNSLTHNVVNANALNPNALASAGSALDDLNGVAVEAVTRPEH